MESPYAGQLSRAQGCLLGQLAGDALGSLVEFRSAREIREKYPEGVRDMADGGTFNTIAGQPTDDSEMALLLARLLAEKKTYDPKGAFAAYTFWYDSGPFDCGNTIAGALSGTLNQRSQANGAMMRVSPLGCFGANHPRLQVGEWARQDAALTHPNQVCQQTNALFTMAIAEAVRSGPRPEALYRAMRDWAEEMEAAPATMEALLGAENAPPADYSMNKGWVLIAFRNAVWQLLHAPNFEEGVVDTIMRGGDTDTTAAICGALLGAVYGKEGVPTRWTEVLLQCRPEAGDPRVRHPRPTCFWPVDALELAEQLLQP